ncbi:MAG TPA: hypothetical protein VHG29_01685 [Novosphingobium sp.]|nr:hypothetical protein [Novosphingobium sp.]
MRKLATVLAAGAALLVGPALQARERLTPQQELAKLLEGRVAGTPVSCISTFGHSNLRVLDNTALVYGSGRTIYVNVPDNPDVLDDDDVLVTRQFGSQLCRMDIVNVVDRAGGFYRGFVGLNDFVPYRKVG